jgi:hypothetical protein
MHAQQLLERKDGLPADLGMCVVECIPENRQQAIRLLLQPIGELERGGAARLPCGIVQTLAEEHLPQPTRWLKRWSGRRVPEKGLEGAGLRLGIRRILKLFQPVRDSLRQLSPISSGGDQPVE